MVAQSSAVEVGASVAGSQSQGGSDDWTVTLREGVALVVSLVVTDGGMYHRTGPLLMTPPRLADGRRLSSTVTLCFKAAN